ncbi:MAG TPA: hypothetical protein VK665_18590, partial [Candidatus Elarobacter sp.]|nr:hypothetical protein [Candidatus Elarobacter sp.]
PRTGSARPRPTAEMPCTDPRDVTRLGEAFDLTTTDIRQWELELIWKAEWLGLLRISSHARRAADDDSIPEVRRGGGWLRAKVGWRHQYVVATVHTL